MLTIRRSKRFPENIVYRWGKRILFISTPTSVQVWAKWGGAEAHRDNKVFYIWFLAGRVIVNWCQRDLIVFPPHAATEQEADEEFKWQEDHYPPWRKFWGLIVRLCATTWRRLTASRSGSLN